MTRVNERKHTFFIWCLGIWILGIWMSFKVLSTGEIVTSTSRVPSPSLLTRRNNSMGATRKRSFSFSEKETTRVKNSNDEHRLYSKPHQDKGKKIKCCCICVLQSTQRRKLEAVWLPFKMGITRSWLTWGIRESKPNWAKPARTNTETQRWAIWMVKFKWMKTTRVLELLKNPLWLHQIILSHDGQSSTSSCKKLERDADKPKYTQGACPDGPREALDHHWFTDWDLTCKQQDTLENLFPHTNLHIKLIYMWM